MRTLYFDCFAGASGDMILGALVSIGVDQQQLLNQLAQLNLENYQVNFEVVDRSGISATYARVKTTQEHHHRHLKDILKIIDNSSLTVSVKERSGSIFRRLAEAEARVHNMDINRVHFHEVGALDAIIDVVGACIGFELLGIERFAASPLHVGSGMVEMAHGRFPVPPPAVAELLSNIPTYATNIEGELLTPTGAAIISTVCGSYGPVPLMRVERTGYGAGTRQYERFPNVLRLMLGNEQQTAAKNTETLMMIETNIDDMSPQQLGYVMDRAFALGGLDCYFTPVQMKKNRPGVLVSILSERESLDRLCQLLLEETTTLGVRHYEVTRRSLEREFVRVETKYGAIDLKLAKADGQVIKAMPEYEQCREAAERASQPLRVIEEAVRDAYARRRKSSDSASGGDL